MQADIIAMSRQMTIFQGPGGVVEGGFSPRLPDFCRLRAPMPSLPMGAACATGSTDPRMRTPFTGKGSGMHIHILGICGTFMGGLAVLAKQLGYRVTGSDANVYPPMSTQLEQQGIELTEGYDPSQLELAPDLVVIGNAMSRGNPCVEYVLDRNLPYISGPQWLLEHVLKDRWVLAVAGTHGKTTTASMLAWVLEYAKLEPGFLIGGVPGNFPVSARLGSAPFFVIEADEYDCAFFDKRSKFVHYHPRTLVMN